MKQRQEVADLLKSMFCKQLAAREICSFLLLVSLHQGCSFYFKLVPGFDELNELFNMPTDQQTLFPRKTELAGSLESARVSRVKTLRKNVISMSYFPHPLKDDKLLLDEKIKWLSLSNFGAASCQHSSPWRMGTSDVLLCIFKVFTPVLETRNILMGLLMLPFPPDSPSNRKERETCWFTGMEKKTPKY